MDFTRAGKSGNARKHALLHQIGIIGSQYTGIGALDHENHSSRRR